MSQILLSRGIRHGDPISPYLFILCMDYLSYLIKHAVSQGMWKPIHLSKNGPGLSHLLFADDIMLYSKTDITSLNTIANILTYFSRIFCQKINDKKSHIFSPLL